MALQAMALCKVLHWSSAVLFYRGFIQDPPILSHSVSTQPTAPHKAFIVQCPLADPSNTVTAHGVFVTCAEVLSLGLLQQRIGSIVKLKSQPKFQKGVLWARFSPSAVHDQDKLLSSRKPPPPPPPQEPSVLSGWTRSPAAASVLRHLSAMTQLRQLLASAGILE